jgi:hypothetical protein
MPCFMCSAARAPVMQSVIISVSQAPSCMSSALGMAPLASTHVLIQKYDLFPWHGGAVERVPVSCQVNHIVNLLSLELLSCACPCRVRHPGPSIQTVVTVQTVPVPMSSFSTQCYFLILTRAKYFRGVRRHQEYSQNPFPVGSAWCVGAMPLISVRVSHACVEAHVLESRLAACSSWSSESSLQFVPALPFQGCALQRAAARLTPMAALGSGWRCGSCHDIIRGSCSSCIQTAL